ncbi:hypothetical protein BDZ88DRAFT_442077 [Geranomyces variabilis]|nr:hypothetical protein BDZ88DRAFT_442077 [Geranomyces variabilis]
MATFTPPALPAGHWAPAARFPAAPTPLNMSGLQTLHRAYLSAAAKIVFLYDGIPNVEKPWLHDVLNEIVAMAAAPLTNPAAPAGATNPPLPLMQWFIQRFYASEFPKNLTANYRLTIASLALQDSLEDYIQSFQRLLQQEDMAIQINGDLMERSPTLAEQTQWFCDGIARNLRMGPHILAAIQQVILHHATVNGGHATMDQIYNAARTALSASGIADGAATGVKRSDVRLWDRLGGD